MSASGVGKCRYTVPTPTSAFFAMALKDTSSELRSDWAAAARMRSWLRRVSARRGLTDPVVVIVSPGSFASFVQNVVQHVLDLGAPACPRCEADHNPLAWT